MKIQNRTALSRDMVGAHQNLNGLRNLAMPLSGMVCHPWLTLAIVNLPSTYQIWSLYLHSLRRYERRYEMSKMVWFGVVRVTQGHWKYARGEGMEEWERKEVEQKGRKDGKVEGTTWKLNVGMIGNERNIELRNKQKRQWHHLGKPFKFTE